MVKTMTRRMLDRTFEPQFFVPLMAKDLDYSARLLAASGITSDLASAARQRFLTADREGRHDSDISSVVEPLRESK